MVRESLLKKGQGKLGKVREFQSENYVATLFLFVKVSVFRVVKNASVKPSSQSGFSNVGQLLTCLAHETRGAM